MFKPGQPWRSILLMPALWIGLFCSVLLAFYVAHWEHRALRNELRELAKDRAQVLYANMRSSTEVLYSLASLHAASGGMALAHFTRFGQDAVMRHPELQAVEWVPRVAGHEREAYERARQAQGHNNFSFTEIGEEGLLTRAAVRAEYFPVYFVEPLNTNAAALGFDLAADSLRLAALEQARDTGLPAVTAPVRLAQETQTQQGFLMFYPVYQTEAAQIPPDIASRRASLQGFALAVFRAGDLVATALRDIPERGLSVAIYDTADASRPLAQQPALTSVTANGLDRWMQAWHGPLQVEIDIDVAEHRWRLVFSAGAQFSAHRRSEQAFMALMVGLMLTALLVAYLANAASRAREIQHANAALQREIGERERAVEVAQAASRAKSDFLANMSHEIRTPLNAVLGYAQLLRADLRLDLSQRDAVKAIISSGNHLLSQINAVLDFSKIETGRMELHLSNLQLNDLLRELELMFRPRCQEKGLNLRVQLLAQGLGEVHADACKLRQILINLLGNAVRFTLRGEVMLGCCVTADGCYRFDVIDTGPGIPAEALASIFEPFYQGAWHAQAEGTGLGLAIARRQVQLLGGSLEVVSEPGEGSRFTLLVPLAQATGSELSATPVAIGWTLTPPPLLPLLIVDDLPANRNVLARLLAGAGCQTLEAEDGASALSQIQAQPLACVFLDIRMPTGGGLELLAAIRAHRPHLPVIAYTALAFEQDRQHCLDTGCQGFISKPVQAEELFSCLETVLGVSFERTWDAVAPAKLNLNELILPPDLYHRLLAAAELHSTTLLKTGLLELEALGGDARHLAEILRHPMAAYDMNTIMHLLLQLPEVAHEDPAGAPGPLPEREAAAVKEVAHG